MYRRGFLVGAGALLAAGCARVSPVVVAPHAAVATAAPRPALAIGDDGTPSGGLLAQLFCQAVLAEGTNATVEQAGTDWQAALGDGTLAALPAYAATLWAQLSDAENPPAGTAGLLGAVATLLAPEVSVLAASGVDGELVWLVTGKTAKAGITSLDRIAAWSMGKVAAVPSVAESRADGVPGVKGVYRGSFTLAILDDPAQRAAQLISGKVAVAAFRRAEFSGTTELVALEDPDAMAVPDPLVLLLDAALGDAEPDAVLAMNRVAELLTTDVLLDLQAKAAAGAAVPAVARQWLATNGLA